MPFAFISIFISLFFSAVYIRSLYQLAYDRYLQYSAIGFHWSFGWPHFDWFSINLEFRRLLIYCLFFTTIFFIFMGARMVLRRFVVTRDMILFMLLYGILAPFWLIGSLLKFLSAKEARWR
jgi:hypothetical protein